MTTSDRTRFAYFCANCSAICAGQSLLCSITPPRTRESRSNKFLADIAACASSTFLPMLRNSTLMKAYGLWPSRSWQTVAPTTWMNYWKISSALSKQFATLQTNCAPVSPTPTCLFLCLNHCIIYAALNSMHEYTDQFGVRKRVFFETTDSFGREEDDFFDFLNDEH